MTNSNIIKVYGASISPYAARVDLTARIKGLKVEWCDPPMGDRASLMPERLATLAKDLNAPLPEIKLLASAEFVRMNPMARIPVLEDAGRYIPESSVICEYLNEKYPDPPLLPQALFDRSRVRLICRVTDLYLMSQQPPIAYNLYPPARVKSESDRAVGVLRDALFELNQLMSEGPWACGASISLADIALLPGLKSLQIQLNSFGENMGLDEFSSKNTFSGHPALARWWAHVHSDPLTARFIADFENVSKQTYAMFAPGGDLASFHRFLKARSGRR